MSSNRLVPVLLPLFLVAGYPAAGFSSTHDCPLADVTVPSYVAIRDRPNQTTEQQLQRMSCYALLLERAAKNKDEGLLAAVLGLGQPDGVHPSEMYSEFLEGLLLSNPEALFDAMLTLTPAQRAAVVAQLHDPLVTERKDIDAVFHRFRDSTRYASIVALYSKGSTK
jgi:hypothetical protein